MARRHLTMQKRYLLLSTLTLFATTVLAQTTGNGATTGGDSLPPVTSASASASASPTVTAQPTTTAQTTARTTTADGQSPSLPPVSTPAGPNDLPKLPTTSGIPTYPAPSVPPTSNAPYMQKSNMPEGTVFIAVGAILGAFGAAILIWRAVVACLLHRSVKRAALAQHVANDKVAMPGAPPAPFYKYSDHESQLSLGAANAVAGRGVRRTNRQPVPSATPSQSNLFFSPTAGNTSSVVGNRSSTFLPSGFYAAGAGAPQQGHGHSISLTNLRPESRGVRPESRGMRPVSAYSPPESPNLTPRHDTVRRHPQMSTSSINLNQTPTGRAPSTYLEDLLDEEPQKFPPAGGPSNWNQPGGRF